MTERFEIRLAGTGGQGIILAGVVLADAAVRDGKNVVQTQSYGPEARGGASRSEVVIASDEIHYPSVLEVNAMLCMSQEACDRYSGLLRKDGLLIVDADHVTRAPTTRAVHEALTQMAIQVTGRKIAANMVGLGLLAGLTGIVSREALEAAVRDRTPRGTEEGNLEALAAGFEAAGRIQAQNAGDDRPPDRV
jgi:2-oxoglutarate ferredoxin oxidoreductase subunit gamma